MGFMDKFKKKAGDLAEEHGDTVDDTIDKGADLLDEKTGGEYSDQIDTGAEKAKDFVEGLSDEDD